MKILYITRNLPPLIGGMERLNWHIADELSKTHDVSLISHTKARSLAPKNTDFYGVPLNPLPIFLILSFFYTFWWCAKQKPDVLFAGSGLTAPIAVFWSKIFRKKSIVYIHGLDIATENFYYNLLWVPFIRHSDQIIANSKPTYELCIKKGVSKEKLSIVHPGVTYPPKPKNERLILELKNKYGLHDKHVLISVGRLTQRKGLNEFIENCLSKIVAAMPTTVLLIVGDTPNNSLNKNLQSKELIISTAKKHKIENNIIFTGNISNDHVLSSLYYISDIHVFPVKHIPEDPEGFGMVAVEAAVHGTPTIAFATGGIVDAVADGQSGFLIENQDYEELTNKVIKILTRPNLIDKNKCRRRAESFSWENLSLKINNVLYNL